MIILNYLCSRQSCVPRTLDGRRQRGGKFTLCQHNAEVARVVPKINLNILQNCHRYGAFPRGRGSTARTDANWRRAILHRYHSESGSTAEWHWEFGRWAGYPKGTHARPADTGRAVLCTLVQDYTRWCCSCGKSPAGTCPSPTIGIVSADVCTAASRCNAPDVCRWREVTGGMVRLSS